MQREIEDARVVVRRQWNDWNLAEVRLSSLDRIHWDTTSGGVRAPTPQPFLHGYVWCDAILAGELSHSCLHGEGPHRIKVCIVKKDNPKAVFDALMRIAGPKPGRRTAVRRSRQLTQDK